MPRIERTEQKTPLTTTPLGTCHAFLEMGSGSTRTDGGALRVRLVRSTSEMKDEEGRTRRFSAGSAHGVLREAVL